MVYYRVALLAVALAFIPTALQAQRIGVSVSAFGGALVPTGNLIDEGSGDDVRDFSFQAGWTAGGRATVWLTSRLGVEAEGAYASTDLDVLNRSGGTDLADRTFSADLIYASVNLMYSIVDPPLTPLSVYVSGGVGVVSRAGNAADFLDSTTDFAGAVGLGVRYGVAPTVTLRLDLRDYISSFQDSSFDDQVIQAGSQLQNDLLVSGGIELLFGR